MCTNLAIVNGGPHIVTGAAYIGISPDQRFIDGPSRTNVTLWLHVASYKSPWKAKIDAILLLL